MVVVIAVISSLFMYMQMLSSDNTVLYARSKVKVSKTGPRKYVVKPPHHSHPDFLIAILDDSSSDSFLSLFSLVQPSIFRPYVGRHRKMTSYGRRTGRGTEERKISGSCGLIPFCDFVQVVRACSTAERSRTQNPF